MEPSVSESVLQAGVTVDITRKLETTLDSMGASGKGLHERVSSIEAKLPVALAKQLRYVAAVRNKLSHNDVVLPAGEFEDFTNSAAKAFQALHELAMADQGAPEAKGYQETLVLKPLSPRPDRGPFLVFMSLFVAFLVLVYMFIGATPRQQASQQPAPAASAPVPVEAAPTPSPPNKHHQARKHGQKHEKTAAADEAGSATIPLDKVRNLTQDLSQ